jgi:SAM-dependent methyltransferase
MNSLKPTTMERKTSDQTAEDTSHSCPAICSASTPPVLDACCGSRMFWFNKQNPRALYLDRRRETHVLDVRPNRNPTVIDPDILGDFTSLPFPDETFWHVIFDPPHTVTNSSAGWKRTKYGNLGDGWREMLRLGFAECFRVLKPNGTLNFKWAESSVPLGEILKLTPEKPLYGHKSGKQQQTHWCAFLKPNVKPNADLRQDAGSAASNVK